MIETLFDGIFRRSVTTPRLTASVLERPGQGAGPTVVFIHGNVSSSLFWQPTMLALPDAVRAIAIDLRGFGDSETLDVDATRGLGDFADDIAEVLAALGVEQAHLVGWSMGGGVVLQLLLERGELVSGLTLVAPVSPFGFGGTGGADGRMLSADGAGTGGGGGNPDFIARLAGDDRSDEPASPRGVYRATYVKSHAGLDHEDIWVESMLTTSTGTGNYPGDSVASDSWPGFAAGGRGVLNTMAPTNFNVAGIVDLPVKPPILWVRGADDVIVSDTSLFDINYLGQLGVIPGWPGEDVAPPQPMISQTRAVLDGYRAAGGSYTELVIADCGHSPHLEHAAAFDEALAAALATEATPTG